MFGMNLVDFDNDSRNLLVSKQLWLYFVISVPLTLATLVCWRSKMQSYGRKEMEYEKGTQTDRITPDMEMA